MAKKPKKKPKKKSKKKSKCCNDGSILEPEHRSRTRALQHRGLLKLESIKDRPMSTTTTTEMECPYCNLTIQRQLGTYNKCPRCGGVTFMGAEIPGIISAAASQAVSEESPNNE